MRCRRTDGVPDHHRTADPDRRLGNGLSGHQVEKELGRPRADGVVGKVDGVVSIG